MSSPYLTESLDRSAIDALPGPVLLNFGTNWCGHCQAAAPMIEAALAGHPGLTELRIEDGKGRRLGRTFAVKLWPTLILLKDGKEVARLVRPHTIDQIVRTLAL
jgi:thioredoxin 1